ncbi:MAG TPA: hypothetical protein VE170_04000 [Candidatus Limnocylindria bacterium]|nr:hypothetical protein [Candidatus Limnocylindria bacterium]
MKTKTNNSAEIFIGFTLLAKKFTPFDRAELECRTGAYPGRQTESIPFSRIAFIPNSALAASYFAANMDLRAHLVV